MNKQETRKINEQFLDLYCGILFNAAEFEAGEAVTCTYRFDCPEFVTLKEKYPIEKIAGQGGDFERALRLCRWLAPRLQHKSDYDNHVPCNALALMDYCFEKADTGINCLNKAKILAECCLSIGIFARRLGMYPASPYDMDNHVVTEIYDRGRKKWILLDPTTGGYFTDGGAPLTAPETRAKIAGQEKISVVLNRQDPKKIDELLKKPDNAELNTYYAKNFFRLTVETISEFGNMRSNFYDLLPKGFDIKRQKLACIQYRINMVKSLGYGEGLLKEMEDWYQECAENFSINIGSLQLWDAPDAR